MEEQERVESELFRDNVQRETRKTFERHAQMKTGERQKKGSGVKDGRNRNVQNDFEKKRMPER